MPEANLREKLNAFRASTAAVAATRCEAAERVVITAPTSWLVDAEQVSVTLMAVNGRSAGRATGGAEGDTNAESEGEVMGHRDAADPPRQSSVAISTAAAAALSRFCCCSH